MVILQVYLNNCCYLEMAQNEAQHNFVFSHKNKKGNIFIIFKKLSERCPVITKAVVGKIPVGGNRKH